MQKVFIACTQDAHKMHTRCTQDAHKMQPWYLMRYCCTKRLPSPRAIQCLWKGKIISMKFMKFVHVFLSVLMLVWLDSTAAVLSTMQNKHFTTSFVSLDPQLTWLLLPKSRLGNLTNVSFGMSGVPVCLLQDFLSYYIKNQPSVGGMQVFKF